MKHQIQEKAYINKSELQKNVKAYILAQTRTKDLDQVLKDTRKLQNIVSVAVISGEWDIIVKTKVNDLEQLMRVTEDVRCIDGIQQVTTYVVEKEIIK